jgi:hypothetical protein
MNEPVTIGERYRKATTTSNLKVEARRSGDADLLIAAGWADSLGIKLYRLAGELDQVLQEIHRAKTQTDSIMVMTKLRTLNQVRVALVGFAIDAAPRWGVRLDQNVMAIVVGKALSAWLDKNCRRCHGTGTFGGYDGRVASKCTVCSGSGGTRQNIGNDEAQRSFALRLLCHMDMKLAEGDARLRSYMKTA